MARSGNARIDVVRRPAFGGPVRAKADTKFRLERPMPECRGIGIWLVVDGVTPLFIEPK
jgi:hypothetical protein